MRKIERNKAKRELKAKRKEIKQYNRDNNIQKNRIRSASFYRTYSPWDDCYVYVIKADRTGEKFERIVPCPTAERDKYAEIRIIYETLVGCWEWQTPDCIDFVTLIQDKIAKTGDYTNVEELFQEIEGQFDQDGNFKETPDSLEG